MKLGRTQKERDAVRKKVPKDRIFFALLPRYCENTERWVWLEKVDRRYRYSDNFDCVFVSNYEMGYDFYGNKKENE